MTPNEIRIDKRSQDNSMWLERSFVPQSGYCLSFDPSLNPVMKAVPGGSGATYKAAYWSDTNTLGSASFLHLDPTNFRVGIGSDSPQYSLDVTGSINISANSKYNISGVSIVPQNTSFVSPSFMPGSQNNMSLLYIGQNKLNSQMFSNVQDAINSHSGTETSPALVVVYPGVYDERLTLKPYVNIHFMPGAVVKSTSASPGDIILADNCGEIAITGDGKVVYDTIPTGTVYLYRQTAGTAIRLRMKYMWGNGHRGIRLEGGTCHMNVDMIDGYFNANNVVPEPIDNAGAALYYTGEFARFIMSSSDQAETYADVKYLEKVECRNSYKMRVKADVINAITGLGVTCSAGNCEVVGARVYNSTSPTSNLITSYGGKLYLKGLWIKQNVTSPAVLINGGQVFMDSCTVSAPNSQYAADGAMGSELYSWNSFGMSLNPNVVSPNVMQRISSVAYSPYVNDIL